MSTVESVEPSLTTMISSMRRLRVSTVRTSAIVFSSLYAAMIAEIPKTHLKQQTLCNGQTITHPPGLTFAEFATHETHTDVRNSPDFVDRLQHARESAHPQPYVSASRCSAARESRNSADDGFRFHGRRRQPEFGRAAARSLRFRSVDQQ